MEIAVCIPVWGRHELTEKVLNRWRRLAVNHPIEIVVGLSEDVPYSLDGVHYVMCENEPLGKKFNDIIYAAGTGFFGMARPDGVLVCGSDNLIHEDYLRYLAQNKPDFCDLGQCLYLEQSTGDMLRHWQAVCGAGKYISSKVLDRCGWQPYEANKNLNVDGGPVRFVGKGERTFLTQPVGPWVIDVKTPDENMWGFDVIRNKYRNTEKADSVYWMEQFGERLSGWVLGS